MIVICVDPSPWGIMERKHDVRLIAPGAVVHGCRTTEKAVALANMEMNQTTEAMARLTWQTARWHGEAVSALRLAVGCATAAEHPGLSAEKLVGVADRAMYAEKSAYYKNAGIDRRRTVQTV